MSDRGETRSPPDAAGPGGRQVLVGGAALIVLLAGCGTQVGGLRYTPDAVPPSSSTTTSVPLDLSGVTQPSVAGESTTTAPRIGPGAASITGTVLAPGGPVAGATVEADRVVDGATVATQTTTGADGSFAFAGVYGGVWRVRAWQAPTLALTTPDVFFLGTTEDQVLTLTLTAFGQTAVRGAITPARPDVGGLVNLEVQVTDPTVDSSGVVRAIGQGGRSVVVTPGSWTIVSANPVTTDGDGNALFQLACPAGGPDAITVALADASATATLDVSCAVAPPSTTTTTPAGGSPTTTTPSGATTRTTTTTLLPPVT